MTIDRKVQYRVVDKVGTVVNAAATGPAALDLARRMNDPSLNEGVPFMRPYTVHEVTTITKTVEDPVDRLPTTVYAHLDLWGSAHIHAYRINDVPGRPLWRATVNGWERA